jgi:hypothetical protein
MFLDYLNFFGWMFVIIFLGALLVAFVGILVQENILGILFNTWWENRTRSKRQRQQMEEKADAEERSKRIDHPSCTFKIIGADGKEYGPLNASRLRQWIDEGRINAQTQVKAVGSENWVLVGQMADFASSLTTKPAVETPPVITDSQRPEDKK